MRQGTNTFEDVWESFIKCSGSEITEISDDFRLWLRWDGPSRAVASSRCSGRCINTQYVKGSSITLIGCQRGGDRESRRFDVA